MVTSNTRLIYLAATFIFLTGCSNSIGSSQARTKGPSSNNSTSTPIKDSPPVTVTPPPPIAVAPPVSETPPVSEIPAVPVTGTPPEEPVTEFKLGCEEARFIHLLNLHRRANGIGALTVSKSAVMASQWHAENMASGRYFSHTEPNGRNFLDRAASFGFAANGENIAYSSSTAAGAFCQWRNSSGHNQNMLERSYTSTGIGMYKGGPRGHYWSSNFGRAITDVMSEPLTVDENCAMPTVVQICS